MTFDYYLKKEKTRTDAINKKPFKALIKQQIHFRLVDRDPFAFKSKLFVILYLSEELKTLKKQCTTKDFN
jgi:hypothetical protein